MERAVRRGGHPAADGEAYRCTSRSVFGSARRARRVCCRGCSHLSGAIMGDTIFDKIIRREIPADIVYENDDVLAFRDLNPQAPVHVLFIPKRSLATLNDATPGDAGLLGKLLLATAE